MFNYLIEIEVGKVPARGCYTAWKARYLLKFYLWIWLAPHPGASTLGNSAPSGRAHGGDTSLDLRQQAGGRGSLRLRKQ
jgi:hypothetical protein